MHRHTMHFLRHSTPLRDACQDELSADSGSGCPVFSGASRPLCTRVRGSGIPGSSSALAWCSDYIHSPRTGVCYVHHVPRERHVMVQDSYLPPPRPGPATRPNTCHKGANLAIKCATYRWSNDGRKSCLYEPPITRKPRRYQVYEGLASDFSATQIPLMCRRLYGEVCCELRQKSLLRSLERTEIIRNSLLSV